MLEEEVYGANSPIWDIEFAQNAVHGSATNGAGKNRQLFKRFYCWFSVVESLLLQQQVTCHSAGF